MIFYSSTAIRRPCDEAIDSKYIFSDIPTRSLRSISLSKEIPKEFPPPLFTIHYSLFIIHYSLKTTNSPLFTLHPSLSPLLFPPFAARTKTRSLPTNYRSKEIPKEFPPPLFTLHSSLFTIHSKPPTLHPSLSPLLFPPFDAPLSPISLYADENILFPKPPHLP